jgi:hypothetical protein
MICRRPPLRHGLLSGLALLAAAGPLAAQCHLRTMTDPQGGFGFGAEVAAQGDTAALQTWQGSDGSLVQLYQRDGSGTWQPAQRLLNPDPANLAHFGNLIALGDEVLAAVALTKPASPQPSSAQSDTVFLYERQGGSFQPTQQFDLGLPVAEFLGTTHCLELAGDTLAVGVHDGTLGFDFGYVQLFERSAGTWTVGQTIHAPSGGPGGDAGFGRQVQLQGDLMVILQAGSIAHLYRRVAGTWEPFQIFGAVQCGQTGYFAFAQWSGSQLLLGLPPVVPGACPGELRVYGQQSPQSPFLLEQTVAVPTLSSKLKWGQQSVADAERLLVSAVWTSVQAPFGHGQVFHYGRDGQGWTQEGVLVPAYPPNNVTDFGFGLGLSGDELFVGAPNDNALGVSSGTVSLWNVGDGPCPSLVGVPDARSLHYVNLVPGYFPAGRHDLLLDAGPSHAGESYLVLGSASGTAPGLPVDGQLLPLVFDAWTAYTLSAPNQGPLIQTFGTLDGQGRALAAVQLTPPLPASLAGLTLHHAFVALDFAPGLQVSFASEPASLFLWP